MTNRRRTAARPSSIRNPISSRFVSVISTGQQASPRASRVWITGRSWTSPFDERIRRHPMRGAETSTAPDAVRCSGWTSNRATGPTSSSVTASWNAWSVEVRAPVSTFALIAATPNSGSAIHSGHPIAGRGRLRRPDFELAISSATLSVDVRSQRRRATGQIDDLATSLGTGPEITVT